MGIRVGTIIISPEVGELLSAQAGGAWTIINPEAGFEAAAYFPSNHHTQMGRRQVSNTYPLRLISLIFIFS